MHDKLIMLPALPSLNIPGGHLKHAPSILHVQASSRSPEAPKLLVCHDMGGGYREDAWANGCKCSNPFYMTHWHLIDTFVYFSHSFVTIPPPGWITCAHTHNTQVSIWNHTQMLSCYTSQHYGAWLCCALCTLCYIECAS